MARQKGCIEKGKEQKEEHTDFPAWVREAILDAVKYGTLEGIHKERKRPKPYSSYVSLLCDNINKEPSSYEEASEKKEWKDATIEKYQLIMKNDIWDVVSRPEGKYVVISKWIYKIKHDADGNIEKYKEISMAHDFS